MSRLLVLTRPALVSGFQLAGVNAYAAEDVETAQEMVEKWLDDGEAGLLAVDDGLLAEMNPALIRRLASSDQLPYMTIPGGGPLGPEASRKYRISEMIRRAIGFHITFKGEKSEEEQS